MYGGDHEYANELGKQGRKNLRKIPKFSINHERFSRTIEKKSKITPTHSSDGILMKSTEVQNPRRILHRVAYYANARARKLTTPHG